MTRTVKLSEVQSFTDALDYAEPRPQDIDANTEKSRAEKKNYAQRLSDACAVMFANKLRGYFPGILPGPNGEKRESQAATAKGFKRLDVNYSTIDLGLALGLSIKTINFRDGKSTRYTKNVTRVDNELRAEAMDYHVRQPWSIMICVFYLPLDSCEDGSSKSPSSFGHAVKTLWNRARRILPTDDAERFEELFFGLYQHEGSARGQVHYFNVKQAPPKNGRPNASSLMEFDELLKHIIEAYQARNDPPFKWADGQDAKEVSTS